MNEASMELVHEKECVITKGNILYTFIKRTFDFIMSFVSIILLCPLFLVLILLVKIDSKGKAIYKHKRIGKDGKYIYLYKFRTMYSNSDEMLKELLKDPKIKKEWEANYKLSNDPRITKVGKFLRKSSLDETPQFINILLGHMSLVGNRPYLPREKEDMGEYYEDIVKTKPGLTGYWQVNGRNDTSFAKRLELEQYYSNHYSLKMDLKIIFKTIKVVFCGKGAN